MHIAYGHISIPKNSINTEDKFMHYAKTWKRYTWDDMIMIFSPMDGQAFDPTKRQIINFLRHDMKSCRENHGKVKG